MRAGCKFEGISDALPLCDSFRLNRKVNRMKIKTLRKIEIAFISVLMLYILTSCYNEEIQYDFPLSDTDLMDVIKEEHIDWSISEAESFEKNRIVHTFENEKEELICSIASYSLDEIKILQLQFYPNTTPNVVSTSLGHIDESEWDKIINFAGKLYGESKLNKKLYSELIEYIDAENRKEYVDVAFNKRIVDTHLIVNLKASKDTELGYDLSGIMIMSNAAYENMVTVAFNHWKGNLLKLGFNVYDNIQLSELSKDFHDVNDVQYLIIEGYLANIEDVKEKDLPSTFIPDIVTSLIPTDYFKATLIDQSGSVEIICRVNSLTIEELKEVRQHCLIYIPDEEIYLLQISAEKNELIE